MHANYLPTLATHNTPRNARECELFLFNTLNCTTFFSFPLGRTFQTNTTQRFLLISDVPEFRHDYIKG